MFASDRGCIYYFVKFVHLYKWSDDTCYRRLLWGMCEFVVCKFASSIMWCFWVTGRNSVRKCVSPQILLAPTHRLHQRVHAHNVHAHGTESKAAPFSRNSCPIHLEEKTAMLCICCIWCVLNPALVSVVYSDVASVVWFIWQSGKPYSSLISFVS